MYAYDDYGKVSSVTQSGAATRTYTYAYKNNAARELASITTGTYQFCPQTDKPGRNAGREISNGENKLAGEYIYYRKAGDHATTMPSSVYFGTRRKYIRNGQEEYQYVIHDNVKYAYDTMGNIIRIDENGSPVVWYKYDALNRLVREDNKAIGKTWLYAYDNKGNILSKRETAFTLKENAEECEFTSVQYAYEGDRLISFGEEECAYDAIGNPTTYCGKSVSWSNGRQMTSCDGTAFTYDGLGRRLSKGDINYTYDGNGRVIRQSNGIEFLYDHTGVAGIIYNNATYIYRKDGQGNILALIDSSGEVVVEYKYDAWGNHDIVLSDASFEGLATANPFRYRGYYYDEETGLYYLKSRYYDPEVGRFITIDDIAILDTTRDYTNGLNLYAYCFNDPVNASDDEGNIPNWLKWLIGGIAFIGAVALTVLSGGSLTPVFVGMGISVIGGGLLQGTITAINGGNFWQGFANGAADGALWGGVFALASAGVSFVKNISLIRSNGVVIGKGMERVSYMADQLALSKYAPMKGYRLISKIFGKNFADILSIAHNKAWIRRVMRLNKNILDIGLGGALSAGAWYGMELRETSKYLWHILY